MPLTLRLPVKLMSPSTSKVNWGVVVLMPILPEVAMNKVEVACKELAVSPIKV